MQYTHPTCAAPLLADAMRRVLLNMRNAEAAAQARRRKQATAEAERAGGEGGPTTAMGAAGGC